MVELDVIPPVWKVKPPENWPTQLQRMSYTQLIGIEGCTRKWSLQHAQYPDIWDSQNYPDKPNIGLLRGRVIHEALEILVKAFVSGNVSTIPSEAATSVIRRLGGFRHLVQTCLERELANIADNPRISGVILSLKARLEQDRGNMLEDLKRLIRRIPSDRLGTSATWEPVESEDKGRVPLRYGIHSEVALSPPGMDWIGYADLMYLDENSCEIRDFKTGGRNDGYSEQLQVYAVLWCLDSELNPEGRHPDRLVISYPDGEVEVECLSAAEITDMASNLDIRVTSARESLTISPPPAKPSWEQCQWCPVKQLCDEYWLPATQSAITSQKTPTNDYLDAQLHLDNRLGPKSFSATVIAGIGLNPGTNLTVSDQGQDQHLAAGRTIRVLNAKIEKPEQEESDDNRYRIILDGSTERFFLETT